jgi:Na+-driven multidrug efflux pump
MLPILIFSFGTCLFVGLGGCLQGEGRTLVFGVMNIISVVCNGALFDPLFLLGIRMGIRGASIATVICETIPALILVVCYFCNRFTVKPKISQLFKKFSPATLPALRIGLSQLMCNICILVPSVIIRKLIGDASGPEFNDALAGYNATVRIFVFTNSVIIAFTSGYLPAESYAYAGKKYKRWISLTIHAFWLTLAWGSLTSVLTWTIPGYIARIFSNGEGYVKWGGDMIRIGNALGFVVNGRFLGVGMLQALQLGLVSTVVSIITQLVMILGFAFLLFYTDKSDGVRIMWSYGMSYGFGFLVVAGVLVRPLMRVWRSWKESEVEVEVEDIREHILEKSEEDVKL